jgi:hypothetical protein
MPKSQGAASSLRVVTARQEALYRGYRIEGAEKGECMLLQVTATRSDLPTLSYSQFQSLPRCTWPKAVEIICGYIDQTLATQLRLCALSPRLRTKIEERRPKFRLE